MSDSIEVKGKSVDEAIYNGLMQLGLGLDEVDIDIIEEGGRRFLGIGKSACVRLTKRETPAYMIPEEEPEEQNLQIEPHGNGHHERHAIDARDEEPPEEIMLENLEIQESEPRERRPRLQQKRKGGGQRRPQRSGGRRDSEEKRDRHEPRAEQVEVPMLDNLDNLPKAVQAVDFLTGLFSVMGLEAAVGVLETSDPKNIRLKITGVDTSVLIGRRGETLDSIQYLTGLVVNRHSDDYIRIMLDAENYRQKRQATLENLARRLAGNVLRTGKPARLEPMNPYERRIMHAALQDNNEVETYSEGVDPNRYVVIRKKQSGSK